jgi:hypothetical protein
MKVALNPAELRLIVDALDDKHTNFSCKAGEGRAGESGVGIKRLGLQPAQCRTVIIRRLD